MKTNPDKPEADRRTDRISLQTLILFSLSGLFLVLALLLFLLKEPPSAWLPVHIHSILISDYSQDPRGIPLAQLNINVIQDVLEDLAFNDAQYATINPGERYADVIANLQTPVPTVTSMPGATIFVPTAQSSSSPTPSTFTVIPTSLTPTDTSSPTPTTTATLQPGLSPTPTLVGGNPTSTRIPATQPPEPTRTQSSKATNTPVPSPTKPPTQPPTATLRPTQPPTATLRPTQPPTATPKPPYPPYP